MVSDELINANEIDTDEEYKRNDILMITGRRPKTIYEFFNLYTREQVDAVMKNLSDEEKKLIFTRYGEDLDNPLFTKLTKEENNKFYNVLIPKMRKSLRELNGEVKSRLKTIYELFNLYTREQVDAVIEGLSDEEKALILARYGEDLDNPLSTKLTKEESNKFYNVLIPKMRSLLFKLRGIIAPRGPKTIYKLFDSYTREQVDAVIENLSDEEKALILTRYGEDLDNPLSTKLTREESNKFYSILVPKMRKLLRELNGEVKSRLKTIYELFNLYTREQVDAVIGNLSDDEKALILTRYGEDLDNPLSTKLTTEENYQFYGLLIPKMRSLLRRLSGEIETRGPKPIYEYFDSYTKEQVDAVMKNLSDEERALISARYEKDTKLIQRECNKFYNVLIPKMRKLLSESDKSKTMSSEEVEILSNNQELDIPVLTCEFPEDAPTDVNTAIMDDNDYIKVLQLIPNILKTMDNVSFREIGMVSSIVALKLGCIEGKHFSNSDISEILGIEPQEVINITKTALVAFKKINSFVDSTMEILGEDKDNNNGGKGSNSKVFYKKKDDKNPSNT